MVQQFGCGALGWGPLPGQGGVREGPGAPWPNLGSARALLRPRLRRGPRSPLPAAAASSAVAAASSLAWLASSAPNREMVVERLGCRWGPWGPREAPALPGGPGEAVWVPEVGCEGLSGCGGGRSPGGSRRLSGSAGLSSRSDWLEVCRRTSPGHRAPRGDTGEGACAALGWGFSPQYPPNPPQNKPFPGVTAASIPAAVPPFAASPSSALPGASSGFAQCCR